MTTADLPAMWKWAAFAAAALAAGIGAAFADHPRAKRFGWFR